MDRNLQKIYIELYRQAFIPIFVNDGLDAKLQVEACVKAGFKVIEYTQRRKDLKAILPWIQETYPNLHVIVGSTIDNDRIVKSQQRHFPQLMTFEELSGLNINGFISMLKYSSTTIQKYRDTHLIIPCASTVNEAYELISDGAHFIKVTGPDLNLVKQIASAPLFKFCPLFVTGGMDLERIPLAIEAGAVLIASGFDLMLKGQTSITVESVCGVLKKYQAAVIDARAKLYPEMTEALNNGATEEWLKYVPNYISIGDIHG